MSLICDYLLKTNGIYVELLDYDSRFVKEASIIEEAKCQLLNNDDITDFDDVHVERNNNSYYLYSSGLKMRIEVQQKMITYYSYE